MSKKKKKMDCWISAVSLFARKLHLPISDAACRGDRAIICAAPNGVPFLGRVVTNLPHVYEKNWTRCVFRRDLCTHRFDNMGKYIRRLKRALEISPQNKQWSSFMREADAKFTSLTLQLSLPRNLPIPAPPHPPCGRVNPRTHVHDARAKNLEVCLQHQKGCIWWCWFSAMESAPVSECVGSLSGRTFASI